LVQGWTNLDFENVFHFNNLARDTAAASLCFIGFLVCPALPSFVAAAETDAVMSAAMSAAPLDEMEVDASRPVVANASGAEPMLVIDGDTIARSGASTIDDYLQRLPAFGFQGVNQNQNSGGYGVSFLDLRNLNFNRTLVLIDGRRVVLSGIKTDEAVDVANIPASLVDHIEVFPDGSQPRHGADAVAGVVNIVLKHDLTGLTLTAGSAVTTDGDGAGGDVSATYGKNLEGGNITVAASWTRRDAIPQADRPWALNPIDSASVGANGTLQLVRDSSATLAGQPVFSGGSGQPRSMAGVAGYDTALSSDLRGGLNRATLELLAHQDVGDGISVYAELNYSNKLSTTLLPPQILGLTGTDKNPDGFVIPAANPFNPYGQAVTLERVLSEVGDQPTRSDSQVFRAVVGLEGTAFADTDWSLSFNHGESRTAYSTYNSVNLTRALQTVSTDPADCPAASGCVAGDYFGAGSLSPAAADYIRYTDTTNSEYLETEVLAQASRPMPVLPGEPWRLTVGTEYRREYGQTMPSAVTLAGDQAGADSAPTAGGYDSREVFADAQLPLIEDRALVRLLRTDASARYVNTDLFGGFTVWKFDVEWAPVTELHFRAGIGTARRVPAITEAFGGSTATPTDVTDPCDGVNGLLSNPLVAANCRAMGLTAAFRQNSALIEVANGGNPRLKPEASRNLNAGLVFTPGGAGAGAGTDAGARAGGSAGGGALRVTADYYRIDVHNAIDSLTDANPDYIPDQCYSSVNLSSPLCALITRTPSGPSAGQISRITAPDQNIGAIDTDGIDLATTYQMPLRFGGRLRLDWQSTVLLDYRVQETPGSAFIQEAGTFPNLTSAGSLTRWRSLLTTGYDRGAWTAEWTMQLLGGARVLGESANTPFSTAPAIVYHDISVQWQGTPLTVAVGVDNLFNRQPPTLIDGATNTNTNTYDVIGRLLYVHASGRW
jgi:outer membrane receptor protein involved in Fe transport